MKKSFLLFVLTLLPCVLFAQWRNIPGPSAGSANAFCAISASRGARMYAATTHGVYLTNDFAKSWQLKGLVGSDVITIMSYDGLGSDALFAIINDASRSEWKLCRSLDSARNWDTVFTVFSSKHQSGILRAIQDGSDIVMMLPGTRSDTAAGIYRSADLGNHWIHQAALPNERGSLSDFIIDGNEIFVIADDTLWNMPAQGAQWTPTSYPAWHIPHSLNFSGNDLFVGANGRIDISTNNGLTWLNPPNTGLDTAIDAISTFAVSGTTIIAAGKNGAYRSTNGAALWQHIEGVGGYPVAYPTGQIILLNGRFFSATSAGVVASADGISWSYKTDGIIGGVEQIASDNYTLFASSERGIFHSTNGGVTWLAPSGPGDLVDSLAHNVQYVRGHVYATSSNSLWRWDDSTWNLLSDQPTSSLTATNQALFAIDENASVIRSRDNGQTWELASYTINEPIQSVIADDSILYAFTEAGDVFSSNNNGDSWDQIGAQNMSGTATSLALAANTIYESNCCGNLLSFSIPNRSWDSISLSEPSELWSMGTEVVAQSYDGVYLVNETTAYPLLDSTGSGYYYGFASDDSLLYIADSSGYLHSEPLASLPLAVSSNIEIPISVGLRVCPNPISTGIGNFFFTLPNREHVSLQIFDARGVNDGTYFDGIVGPGQIQIPFDVAQLASGNYVAVLSAPGGSAIARIVLLP